MEQLYLHRAREILYYKKMHNLMKAFPGLTSIRIDRLSGDEIQSLEILPSGAQLTPISLVGFDDITDEHISCLHWAFHRQQALDKAAPLVEV